LRQMNACCRLGNQAASSGAGAAPMGRADAASAARLVHGRNGVATAAAAMPKNARREICSKSPLEQWFIMRKSLSRGDAESISITDSQSAERRPTLIRSTVPLRTKTYAALAQEALLSFWLPLTSVALLSSPSAPTTNVLPDRATMLKPSPAPLLEAFTYACLAPVCSALHENVHCEDRLLIVVIGGQWKLDQWQQALTATHSSEIPDAVVCAGIGEPGRFQIFMFASSGASQYF